MQGSAASRCWLAPAFKKHVARMRRSYPCKHRIIGRLANFKGGEVSECKRLNAIFLIATNNHWICAKALFNAKYDA